MEDREVLFGSLGGPSAREAVVAIRRHPEWLTGKPSEQLIRALQGLNYDAEGPVFALARDWERGPMAEALWEAFDQMKSPAAREHAAWLVKGIPGGVVWARVARAACDPSESPQVRVFLFDSLDRLAFSRVIGWPELRGVIDAVRRDPEPAIRERAAGIIMSLPESDEGIALLLLMLKEENVSVLAAVLQALDSLGVRSDAERLQELARNPTEGIRRRAKRILGEK